MPLASAVVHALAMRLELALQREVRLWAIWPIKEGSLDILQLRHEDTLQRLGGFEFPFINVLLNILKMPMAITPEIKYNVLASTTDDDEK